MSARIAAGSAVLIVLLALGSVTPGPKPANLISNGGFELWEKVSAEKLKRDLTKGHRFGDGPPYLLPKGWRFHYTSSLPGRLRRIQGKPGVRVHSGKSALLCQILEPGQGNRTVYLTVPAKLEPGKTYRLSFWAKGDGKFHWRLHQHDGEKAIRGKWRSYREFLIPFWEKHEAPLIRLEEHAREGAFRIDVSGTMILDDVAIVEVK